MPRAGDSLSTTKPTLRDHPKSCTYDSTLLEKFGPAFKCIYQNYYYRDEHDDDDDTAINLSAMFFRIRSTAAYPVVGWAWGG